jgi:hypothetical protein
MPAASAPRRTAALLAFSALLAASAPAQAREQMPFVGVWDCEVALFTFTNETYNPGDEPMPILSVEREGDHHHLTFADNYRITLSNVTETSMGWLSEASGDGFGCVRVWW